MCKNNANTSPPQAAKIIIDAGGKSYQVNLQCLTEFLDTCFAKQVVIEKSDLQNNIDDITEYVIDGMDDHRVASALKRPLQFLRELDNLFIGLLHET